jgi:hypothetical protein
VTASKDEASAPVQAALVNVPGVGQHLLMGGHMQTTSGWLQQWITGNQRRKLLESAQRCMNLSAYR